MNYDRIITINLKPVLYVIRVWIYGHHGRPLICIFRPHPSTLSSSVYSPLFQFQVDESARANVDYGCSDDI